MAGLQDIDLNLLVVLRELLDTSSVSRAARRLGRTQSAVSHSLGRLRETFDDPLLVRSGRRLEPTPFALSLVEPVQQALEKASVVFLSRGTFEPARLRRRFSLSASDYAEAVVLPRLWPALRERAPGVELALRFTGDDIDREVQTGRIDLGLGANFRDHPGLFRRRLYTEELAVVCRRARSGGCGPWTLERFLAAEHVLASPRGREGSFVDTSLAERGVERRVVLTTPHFLVALHLVARTDAVVTLPRQLALVEAEGLRLDVSPLPFEPPRFAFGMLFRELSRYDPAHTWLRELIAEVCVDLSRGR